jgi:Tfp pilus assembly protein PilO
MLHRLWGFVKRNRKAQALILLLAVIIAVDAVYYVEVCRPVKLEAAVFDSRLSGLDIRYKKTGDAIRRYEDFIKGRESLQKFKLMLASRQDYTSVIKKVYTLASKDGMEYKSFGAQTSELAQVGGLEQLSFTMPVSGSYRDVRKFIYDVETSDLFLNINTLGLATISGGSGKVGLSIGLSTYVRS